MHPPRLNASPLPPGLRPVTLDVARAWIRESFQELQLEFFQAVQRPMGWRACNSAAEIAHPLTWCLGCEVRSSFSGLSLFLRPSTDWHEPFPLVVELRFFIPRLEIAPPAPPWPAGRNSTMPSAHLFIDRALQSGQRVQLLSTLLEAPTVSALAKDAAARVNALVSQEVEKGLQAA